MVTTKKTAKKKVKKTVKKTSAKKTAKKNTASVKTTKKSLAKKQAPKKTASKKTTAAKSQKPTSKKKQAPKKTVAKVKKAKVAVKGSKKAKVNKVKQLTPKEKREIKSMLVALRQRISGQVTSLTKDSLFRNEDFVSPEDGTDAFDRQFALAVASSEQNALFDIEDALRRLDQGIYGSCEDCGCLIKKPRMKALPFVRLCIKCQSEVEQSPSGKSSFRRL